MDRRCKWKNSSFTLLLDSFDYVWHQTKDGAGILSAVIVQTSLTGQKKTNKIKFEVKNMERIK